MAQSDSTTPRPFPGSSPRFPEEPPLASLPLWESWERVGAQPTNWQEAVAASAEAAFEQLGGWSERKRRLSPLVKAIPAEVPAVVDHSHTSLLMEMDTALNDYILDILGLAALLGYGLAKSYPADIKELANWIPAALAYIGPVTGFPITTPGEEADQ